MKKLLYLGLIVCFLLLSVSLVFADDAYPKPKGRVNDFADILPVELESMLEENLREYEIKTTNEIAVVTVSSLNGLSIEDYTMGLAEEWKVGKKGKDNGVIVLVAPNEKAVRIEVGYGLESVLTDAETKMVIETKMIPLFKKGDYGSAILAGVKKIEDVIGYLTPEEIEQQKKEQEENNRAVTAILFYVMIGIIAVVILILLIAVSLKKISVWRKERKRKESVRRQVLKDIAGAEEDLRQILARVQKSDERFAAAKQYPAAMAKEQVSLAADIRNSEKKTEEALQEAKTSLKKNPDSVKPQIDAEKNHISRLQENLRRYEIEWDNFDAARLSHDGQIQKAYQSLQEAGAYLAELKEKGYFISPDDELAPALQDMKTAQDALQDDIPDYLLVIRYAQRAADRALAAQHRWGNRIGTQRANDRSLGQLCFWLANSLPQLKSSSRNALSELSMEAPLEIWEPLVNEFGQRLTVKTEFEKLSSAAKNLNGMHKQDFEAAAIIIEKINNLKKETEASLARPAKTLHDFVEARSKTETLILQASRAVNQAEIAVRNSDAEGAGSGKLQEAQGKVSKAKNYKASNLPNWLLVAGLLAGAISLAQAAESEAKNRADEVEAARRRKKREQDERRRNSYYYGSSWSSGSLSSGHSGGGFGGFGGGSFGGGGASGHW